MLAVLSVGSGDGSVTVDVDGYGSFGRDQEGTATGDAIIDQIGPLGTTELIYESGTAIGVGAGAFADRRFLTDGSIGNGGFLPSVNVSVSADGTSATSSFALAGLSGSLVQVNTDSA